MKNKTHARISSLIPNFRYIATPVVLGLCLVQSANAVITTWSGATDNNWSTAGNWDSGLPTGNDVVFAATDATGTTGPSGTVNNIVDADTTVTTLKYTNLETTGYHTTSIPTGVTLTVNGSGTNVEVQSPTTGTDRRRLRHNPRRWHPGGEQHRQPHSTSAKGRPTPAPSGVRRSICPASRHFPGRSARSSSAGSRSRPIPTAPKARCGSPATILSISVAQVRASCSALW